MSNSPTPIHSGTAHALSVVGRVRDHNEDSVIARQWSANQPGPCDLEALLAVADGMGGHERGEWASSTALSILESHLAMDADSGRLDAVLLRAFSQINETIYQSSPDVGQAHPGTTLTVALVRGNTCTIVHVGDSRLYLYRNRLLTQVTEDHSWAAELVRQGEMTPEQAANWVHKNQITRAVGVRQSVEPAIYRLELQSRDVLLLCSDGLSGMLSDEQIASAIALSSSAVQAGETLCAAANEAGGEDNISVALYSHDGWPLFVPSSAGKLSPPTIRATKLTATTLRKHLLSNTSLAVIATAVLLLAGLLFLLIGVHRGSNANRGEQVYGKTQARLRVQIDKQYNLLLIEAEGANLHGIPLSRELRWDAARLEYKLGGKTPVSSLDDGSALLELCGVENVKVRFDSTDAWDMAIKQSAAYQLVWVGNARHTIAAFRIQTRNCGQSR